MIVGIVLAAGQSRRMGAQKLCMPLGNSTVLGQTLRLAVTSSALDRVVLVASPALRTTADISHSDAADVVTITNDEYQSGMASSLRAGLRFVTATMPLAEAAVILLGDQPTLHRDAIAQVVAAYHARQPQSVVPYYGTQRGHPIVFARLAWPQLTALSGDVGARSLLDRDEPAPLIRVDLPEAWLPRDIDTPEDYHAVVKAWPELCYDSDTNLM